MSERHFEQSMNPKEHIQSELEDAGISHPSEWRKALDLETPLEGEEGMESDRRSFEKLLSYLDGEKKISEKEKIEKFSTTQDSIERLEVLRSMSLGDAIVSIRDYSATEGPYRYLANRLDFYQKFIQGKATKRQTESEYDQKKGEYVQVEKEYPIDASNASPETVRLGLLRDVEFAAMIGTPELGIYKVVDKRLKEKKISKTHMPELKGYHSGIHEGSIGYAYPVLRKLYEKARKHVEGRMGDKKAEEQVIEHRSVILASNWLEEAMNYNNPGRGPESPYVGSLDEAIAWGRLGPQVKKQLLGMRRKIQGVDLHNIERFVGKSGDDKYDPERKRLFGQIKFFKEGYDQEKKQEFTTKENGFAVQKQHKWHEKEIERLNHRLEKSKAEIEKANLPDEERELQLQSVLARHQEAIANVEQDYQNTVTRLQERTPDQLLADLEQRQAVVNERHEKRKSLAQKALDLHFKINHAGRDYNSKPFAGIVDWINYAPLGAIKRGHKMMRLGMSDETITEYALADIIAGARGATREDIKVIHELVEKAKGQDWNAKQKLEAMMKVGNIISLSKNEVTLEEVSELAGKNFYGMTEALKMYSLEQVKQFMDQGINLQSITTARKITEKFGHDLAPNVIAEIASHDINGLEDGLRSFDLDDTTTLLRQDVKLPVAVAVLNNTKQFGYELNITQIANVAKNVHDINDFTSALRGLPLSEVEKLFTVGVPYSEFSKVKGSLERHGLDSDFNASLLVAQKLIKNNEYDSLDKALEFYQLNEIDQIISKGIALASVISVREVLQGKSVTTDLQETIQLTKYASEGWNHEYYVGQAIDTFGIDNVRKIVAKSCRLDKAIEVNNYINGDSSRSRRYGSSDDGISKSLKESLKKGGLDVVIAIAKAGNMEIAVKTIEAGFTVEEITRFPFLISPLVTKK
ncbi:MAG: hypothetical protein PHR29_04215 [Acholeplasmataceae bacterium]|nr:hypothetical protein [Acholeplasmataceae bacterium]